MSMKKTDPTLQKCEELIDRLQDLKKALTATRAQSSRKPIGALGSGWSQDAGTGAFHHSTHGIISTSKHPDGYFQISHGGRPVGRATDIGDAGMKIKKYVSTLQAGDTGMHNMDTMAMKGDVEKSGYGPKGAGQYDAAANMKRKATNVGGDKVGTQSVKSYSHKNAFAHKPPQGPAGPVKQYTPEQIAAVNEARKLKKNAEDNQWMNHSSIPNADAEVAKLQKVNPTVAGEDAMANQLVQLMHSRAMLNPSHRQPSSEDMIMAGERMGLGQPAGSAEELKKVDAAQWNGTINNWLVEAQKPISQRFDSPEAEQAYWDSIKVSDRDDGRSGY